MKYQSFRSSAAALCVAAFTLILTSTSQAGGFDDLLKMLGLGTGEGTTSTSMTSGSASNRGTDDPANHDANDDHHARQPADDRGRHRGRGR